MLSNEAWKDYSNAIASIGETLNQFARRDQTDLKRRYVEKRKPGSGCQASKCHEVNRKVASISSNSPLISNFLCISSSGCTALWTYET